MSSTHLRAAQPELGANRLAAVTPAGPLQRAFTYDGAGNLLTDVGIASSTGYGYNQRNRLATVTIDGALRGTYRYNGLEQLASRVITNTTANATIHTIHDARGNVIAETLGGGASGATGTTREYIWLPEAGYAGTDLALAVVDNVNTAAPLIFKVCHRDATSEV